MHIHASLLLPEALGTLTELNYFNIANKQIELKVLKSSDSQKYLYKVILALAPSC